LRTDTFKIPVNIVIGKAKHLQTVSAQYLASFFIVTLALFCIMLRPIDFDDQTSLRTVKVYDERLNDPLLVELYRVSAQILIPELAFL